MPHHPLRPPGSPAHAGMDPRASADSWNCKRLPRTRGDGPGRSQEPRSQLGLPRTRGDGPLAGPIARQATAAPPHTRGWTRVLARMRHARIGSPAHAGMDRRRASSGRQSSRLPRTRGDGPVVVTRIDPFGAAPPHTRGWTASGTRRLAGTPGSPAHAGMDPDRHRLHVPCDGLPRTRGDGPYVNAVSWSGREAPPHTRGWTRVFTVRGHRQAGSPAHAGMDPYDVYPILYLSRAPPHTRGWTVGQRFEPGRGAGSPAHAGMDPADGSGTRPCAWLPRTRGDGPCSRLTSPVRTAAPPHTRGWTLQPSVGVDVDEGSPAHAGMDPALLASNAKSLRLPRTRGDGPGSSTLAAALAAPPHTRGWTPRMPVQHGPAEGSPAHAGMDPSPAREAHPTDRLPRTRGDGPCGR